MHSIDASDRGMAAQYINNYQEGSIANKNNKVKEFELCFGNNFSDMTQRENITNELSVRSFVSVLEKKYLPLLGQASFKLQDAIDGAKRETVIELPETKVSFSSLVISKPVTLIGKPGTILEVDEGSISVNFVSGAAGGEPSSLNSKLG